MWGENGVGCPEGLRWGTSDDSRSGLAQESIAEIALSELREEICSAARQRGTEHAEAGGRFELEKFVSCSSDGRWGRTKWDLGGGEPLDNHHRRTTLGTAPKVLGVRGRGDILFRW